VFGEIGTPAPLDLTTPGKDFLIRQLANELIRELVGQVVGHVVGWTRNEPRHIW